jgi:TetR/AcrR family transcriptional regulator, mexJK operon transcriptional repressor
MRSRTPIHRIGEERHARILAAALEVFSKSSYWDATTDEIARRAHVSKRDIYAEFPDKHAILAAVISRVLQTGDENLRRVISDSDHDRTPQRERLEVIGLALMSEILSPVTGFVSRLVASECINHPSIGTIYFENWHARRCQLMARVFSATVHLAKSGTRRSCDTNLASQHYLALISHLPQLTAGVGMRDTWNSKSIQAHVRGSVDCFLKAYPILA